MYNLNDAMMEQISNAGNGNYFYIDSRHEAKKVFKQELAANMFTIAKDVKIQVEFNPNTVKAYRLIGYENRMLKNEDFKDDKIDAGELGAGHVVTALYEIMPASNEEASTRTHDELKYQTTKVLDNQKDLVTLKLRYKPIKSDTSIELQNIVQDEQLNWEKASVDFQFAASVAGWGMYLRSSEHFGDGDIDLIKDLAKKGLDNDKHGHRIEFIDLVNKSEDLF